MEKRNNTYIKNIINFLTKEDSVKDNKVATVNRLKLKNKDDHGDYIPLNKVKYDFFKIYMSKKIVQENKDEIFIFLNRLLEDHDLEYLDVFYEIMVAHESELIRKWAFEICNNKITTLDKEKQKYIYRRWINYPRERISSIIKKIEVIFGKSNLEDEKALLLIGSLFDKDTKRVFDEADFKIIEKYISNKPLLYSPIQRRINRIRSRNYINQGLHEITTIKKENDSFFNSVNDLIYKPYMAISLNPEYVWNHLINSPLVVLIENFPKIQAFRKWYPRDGSRIIFEMVKEIFQGNPWEYHDILLNELIYCDFKNWDMFKFNISLGRFFYLFHDSINFNQDLIGTIEFEYDYNEEGNDSQIILFHKLKTSKMEHVNRIPLLTISFYNENKEEVKMIGNKIIYGENKFYIDLNKLLAILTPPSSLNKDQIIALANFISDSQKLNDTINEYVLNKRKLEKYALFFKKLASYWASFHYNLENIETFELNSNEIIIEDDVISGLLDSAELDKNQKDLNIIISIDFGNTYTKLSFFNVSDKIKLDPSKFVSKDFKKFYKVDNDGLIFNSGILYNIYRGFTLIPFDFEKEKNTNFEQTKIINDLKFHLIKGNYNSKINIAGKYISYFEAIAWFFKLIFGHLKIGNIKKKTIFCNYSYYSESLYIDNLREIFQKALNISGDNIIHFKEIDAACFGIKYFGEAEFEIEKKYLLLGFGSYSIYGALIKFNKESELVEIDRYDLIFGSDRIEKRAYWKIKNEQLKKVEKNYLIFHLKNLKEDENYQLDKYFKVPSSIIGDLHSGFKEVVENRMIQDLEALLEHFTYAKNDLEGIYSFGLGILYEDIKTFVLNKIKMLYGDDINVSLSSNQYLITEGMFSMYYGGKISEKSSDKLGLILYDKNKAEFVPILKEKTKRNGHLTIYSIRFKNKFGGFNYQNIKLFLYTIHQRYLNYLYNDSEESNKIPELDELEKKFKDKYLIEKIQINPLVLTCNLDTDKYYLNILINSRSEILYNLDRNPSKDSKWKILGNLR